MGGAFYESITKRSNGYHKFDAENCKGNSVMDKAANDEIIQRAKMWFRTVLAPNHIKNTKKLSSIKEFDVNPFLLPYLANFLEGQATPESLAKALIYPRILGVSISTSFGQNLQKFISDVLGAYGSTTQGIDLEFVDKIDGHKKYCQLKAGPNILNKGDVEPINEKFQSLRRLAKTNNLSISPHHLMIGVLYGERSELSGHYKALEHKHNITVLVGQEFWHRLTGDEHLYAKLIAAFAEVANEHDGSTIIAQTIQKLAATDYIQSLARALKVPQG